MIIGTGKRVRVKCPICAMANTVSIEHTTLRLNWLLYSCSNCKVKFRLPKGWRKEWLQRRRG